jgi:hypothetical protein
MTHGIRIRTGLGIVVSLLVVASSAQATTITVVRDVSARDVVNSADLANSAPTRPIQVVRDVSARDARESAGKAAIAYFKANERSTLVDSAGPAAIAYFRANERATMDDGSGSVAATSADGVRAARASGFDWGDAGVGASSAFLLALLVGVSLLAARHLRSSPVPR